MLSLLRGYPEGITELALMNALDDAGYTLFDREERRDPAVLYRSHFILFHLLYCLRTELAPAGEDLEIHCLDIRLRRCPPAGAGAGNAVAEHDGVADFYMDLENLEGMDADAVDRLIAEGLSRIERHGRRGEALSVLGLEEPASVDEVRLAYRRLAMRHHPDRGGDTETLQRINEAYLLLAKR